MSETQEPQPPKKTPYVPGQPLPRLWKTEPDPSEDDDLEETEAGQVRKKTAKCGEENGTATKKPLKPKSRSNSVKAAKSKSKSAGNGDPKEKRVLLEETPTFDTVEARHRARMIVGGLSVFCVFLLFWITYSVFLSNPSDVEMSAELPSSAPPSLQVSLPLEDQARYLFNRAHEFAKAGRPEQAVGMLKRVVNSYKGTRTALEARKALDRPAHNLPLFPAGLAVLAEQQPVGRPSVPGTAPGNRPGPGLPPPGNARVATGPVAMLGPEALIPVQRPGQPGQPPPAVPQVRSPQSGPLQPTQPQAAATPYIPPQSGPPQATPPQPAQPGPGQAVLVPPANPTRSAETPAPAQELMRTTPTSLPGAWPSACSHTASRPRSRRDFTNRAGRWSSSARVTAARWSWYPAGRSSWAATGANRKKPRPIPYVCPHSTSTSTR